MSARGDLVLAFTIAVGAHAGVAHLGALDDLGGGGGDRGSQRVTIAAAAPAVAGMVRDWEQPPQTTDSIALRSPHQQVATPLRPEAEAPSARMRSPTPLIDKAANRAPSVAALQIQRVDVPSGVDRPIEVGLAPTAPRVASLTAPTRPKIDTSPDIRTIPPAADFAPTHSESPPTRPNRSTAPAIKRNVATGTGASGTRGSTQITASKAATDAERQAVASAWATEIQRRIARYHVYPRDSRDEGRVRVAMIILPSGNLTGVSIERSSGSRSLDQAALAAVKSAAPFPPAPKILNESSYSVGQWITFKRR